MRWRLSHTAVDRDPERAQATVEFALVLPLVALLLIGLVEVARVGALHLGVVDAARNGARAAAVDPRAEAARSAAGVDGDGASTLTMKLHGEAPRLVTVTVERRVSLVPGLGWSSVALRASSTMALERGP